MKPNEFSQIQGLVSLVRKYRSSLANSIGQKDTLVLLGRMERSARLAVPPQLPVYK
jgi:hypothetical protein